MERILLQKEHTGFFSLVRLSLPRAESSEGITTPPSGARSQHEENVLDFIYSGLGNVGLVTLEGR